MAYSLQTAEDVYKAVLDGIKKESTAVLTPEAFNRLFNIDAVTEWLQSKASKGEFDQVNVDAFSNLINRSPVIHKEENRPAFKLPDNYYRLISVSFRIKNDDLYTEIWQPAYRNKPDTHTKKFPGQNPYRETNDNRVYYIQEGKYLLNFPENPNVYQARMMYYARPIDVIFNVDPIKRSNGNLLKEQYKEIVDIAVRIFLERVKEERYQTILVEDRLKQTKQ